MIQFAEAPVLMQGVMDDPADVVGLLERNAPYTPLGGWYRPGLDPGQPSSSLWFQNDWVHADYAAQGSELFMEHEAYHAEARRFYDAEVILPHSLYVNMMVALPESGPPHTDNPKFRGRERKNTPMWLLRTMLWSGLFERWEIVQATSIWWLNDTEQGGLSYWADGPDKPPHRHVGNMANTALLGDNHRMFHQVEPVGPFDGEPRLVTAKAELAPVGAGSGDWAIRDRGEEVFRAPLDGYRVSVLWKADVYSTEQERQRVAGDTLSLEGVAEVFDRDLEARGEKLRLDLARLEDPALAAALAAIYPEATPVDAGRSMYQG
jgi:hypothetical protein